MSTILVTGASGMIGKIVVASLLSKKHKVVGTDSKPSDLQGVDPNFIFTQADITRSVPSLPTGDSPFTGMPDIIRPLPVKRVRAKALPESVFMPPGWPSAIR